MILPPAGVPEAERAFWCYEARWLRPDVYWSLPEWLPAGERAPAALFVGAAPPPGFDATWSEGGLTLAVPREPGP